MQPQNADERLALALCRRDAGTFEQIGRAAGVNPFRVMELWDAELREIRAKRAA